MSRGYPAPPHVVAGFVVADGDAALRQLTDALHSLGAPDGDPPLLDVNFGDDQAASVELTLSGDLVGMPPWISLEAEDQAAAARTLSFLRRAFETACDRLDPLYAGVDLEWRIPAPSQLTANEARLPGDLFWSSLLDERDPDLADALEGILGMPSRPFARGRVMLVGGLLDPATQASRPSLAAGRSAAARLARAL